MRLVEQRSLVYRAGATEKVYEIDLCEVGAGRFVVNYRYGRRGSPLKEGSKTVAPVAEAEARRVFEDLLQSRIEAGYELGGPGVGAVRTAPPPPVVRSAPPLRPLGPTPPRSAPPRVQTGEPRADAVLDRLRQGARGGGRRPWPLSRAIWRAGELSLREAVPLLVGLAGSGDDLQRACVAWALGRCGVGDPAAAAVLRQLRRSAHETTRRFATAGLLLAGGDADRTTTLDELARSLPPSLGQAVAAGDASGVQSAFEALKTENANLAYAALDALVMMNTPAVRATVLSALRDAPLAPPAFRTVRHAFKLAELRRDGELFGLLAWRFEKTRAGFQTNRRGGARVADRGGRARRFNKVQLHGMLSSEHATAAYSDRTRWYLRQRAWRTLRRLGEAGDSDYVKMAVGALIPWADADAGRARSATVWRLDSPLSWGDRLRGRGRGRHVTVHWDVWARAWIFSHILFRNSPRYFLKGREWRCNPGFTPGQPAPAAREEAFPELWDRLPQGLLHLLDESRCEPVHHFAVQALRANGAFVALLDAAAVAMLLGRPYAVTARYGAELARERLARAPSDADLRVLVVAMATAALDDVRREGLGLLTRYREVLLGDGAALAALLAAPHADTRRAASDLLRGAWLAEPVERALLGALVARLLALGAEDAAAAQDLADAARLHLGRAVRGLGTPVLLDLARHPLLAAQGLAVAILQERGGFPPEDVLAALLDSDHGIVRAAAVGLFERLSDADLIEREYVLVALATHRSVELRDGIRAAIRRLAGREAGFGGRMAVALAEALLTRRLAEGVPGAVVRLIREDLRGFLGVIPRDTVWRLLRSTSTAAQELGGILLPAHLDPDTVPLEDVLQLADHEVLAVRQAAWGTAGRMVPRLREDLGVAVALLDAKWDDTRAFAFELFRQEIRSEDYSPAVLVSVCDSVRPDVQAFGRELIARHGREEDGDELLLRLSEHPSTELQLFATNWLERYAAGDAGRLAELEGYFRRVLGAVNRGRTARLRVHAFLRAEADRSEPAARLVARVLDDRVTAFAVEDRAAAVETLARIARRWPEIPLSMEIRGWEIRSGL